MKISVIMPARNVSGCIRQALHQLNAQTKPPYEIIVADDLSTDNTADIARVYGCKVVKNLGTEPWGISGGRNAAFTMSTGDAILPLDADDWLDLTHLEKTSRLLNGNIGIVSTHMRYFGEREGTIVRTYPMTFESELHLNGVTVCSLIRREAIQQVGGWDPKLKAWEDWDMWLRILQKGWKHAVVPETLFHYHVWNSGMNAWGNQHREELIAYMRTKFPNFLKR